MSSLVDAVINSDNLLTSDPVNGDQERQKRRERERMQRGYSRPRSSSRPQGPPSESAGARSDVDGMIDDEVLAAQAARRRRGAGRPRADIPRMVDSLGENVFRRFEDFLEKYVIWSQYETHADIIPATSKISRLLVHPPPAVSLRQRISTTLRKCMV